VHLQHTLLDKRIDTEQMKRLKSIGLAGDIMTTEAGKRCNNSSWDDMFKLLLEFKQKYGHCMVPRECNENGKLGRWVMTNRRNYRAYKRTNGQKGNSERMKHLESIGLVDDITTGYEKPLVTNSRWDDMFKLLLEFKKKHGHVKVPARYYENPKLGTWVKHRRKHYKEYKRTNGQKGDPEQMKRLESIGLVDDISTGYEKRRPRKNSSWDDMINQLLEFKQKHGHCKVSRACKEYGKLRTWVLNRRRDYREYKRTNGQKVHPYWMKRLESIGLLADVIATEEVKRCNNSRWDDMFKLLLEFKQKHGHLKVPRECNEYGKLGRWVGTNRKKYREYKQRNGQKVDPEQMMRLESIGLVDDIIKIHEDKIKDCANDKVFAPIIVSSISPTLSSNTQNITEEMPLLTVMKEGKNGGSGDDTTQADLDFLGSELRGKGGFWV
jgi:glycerol-3-phosphate cytidylyltransferase-like family protein